MPLKKLQKMFFLEQELKWNSTFNDANGVRVQERKEDEISTLMSVCMLCILAKLSEWSYFVSFASKKKRFRVCVFTFSLLCIFIKFLMLFFSIRFSFTSFFIVNVLLICVCFSSLFACILFGNFWREKKHKRSRCCKQNQLTAAAIFL